MVTCSVIVTSHNCLDYSKVLLYYYNRYTHDSDVQLVWVDNNSTDGTREWLETLDLRHTILLDENKGAGQSRNIAVKEVNTDAVCLMDNDIRPTQVGWINRLLRLLYRSKKIGAVAPACNLIFDDTSTRAFIEPVDKTWARIPAYKRKDSVVFGWDEDVYPYISKYLSILRKRPFQGSIVTEGGGTTMERQTYLDTGGFSDQYEIAHEGHKMTWELSRLGLQTWIEPSVFLFHYGHATRNYEQFPDLDERLRDSNSHRRERERHYMELRRKV